MRVSAVLTVVGVCLFAGSPAAAQWAPLDPAQLAATTPRLDPNADAEALLWEVKVLDDDSREEFSTVLEHHLRLKIYNDRGREAHSRVDIPYLRDRRVRDVRGRTVSPAGAITELAGSDVHDRTIIETNGVKVKVKSFVMPAVVPGSIVEYRWREIRDDSIAHYLELPFQREVPVHLVRYHIKPLNVRSEGYQMRSQMLNVKGAPPQMRKGDGGYSVVEMRDLPAVKREQYMPSQPAVRAWMLLYYADLADTNLQPERFWQKWGNGVSDGLKESLKSSNEIKAAATEAIKGAGTDDEKVDAIVRYVRARVVRTDLDESSAAEKPSAGARDTLKRGRGDAQDVNVLFTALAVAAGLDARMAVLPDRDEYVAPLGMKQPFFLSHLVSAVRKDKEWRFVDAAHRHGRNGHLRWQQEGTYALVLGGSAPLAVDVPTTQPSFSVARRSGTLKVLPGGGLEGQVTMEYSGHLAARYRERDSDETPAARERFYVEDIGARLAGATVANVTVENLEQPDLPYIVRFTLTAPAYGQRAGSRILLAPAVLQQGRPAPFATAERVHSLVFPFAWSEEDAFTVTLPDGYELEAPSEPSRLTLGDNYGHSSMEWTSPARGTVAYARSFAMGGGGSIFLPATAYSAIKQFFDHAHGNDQKVMPLRPVSGQAGR